MIRYGYFPVLCLGVNGLALAVIFSELSPAATAAALLGLLGLALWLSFAAERLLPYQAEWNSSRGDLGRDVLHFLVNESLSLGPLLAIPLFVEAAPRPAASLWPTLWPTGWPLWLQVLFTLVVFDLGQNLFHWASHRIGPLWRLHAVHHEVQRMYGLNGIMKHPIYQVAASLVSTAPLLVLGMPARFSLVLAFCTAVQLLLQHSNADYRTGGWRRVFATAEVHRFHHLKGKAGDVNFALFFSFWDHLLGHAHFEPRKLASGDIGLDYVDYPQSWAGQMAAPFRRFPVRSGAAGQGGSPIGAVRSV